MIIALHGFTGSPASWDRVLPGSALAPELVGHGGPLSQSFEQEVERLADVIRCRTPEPVTLVGYSMGARFALGIACAHPELAGRLVLIGVNPGLPLDAERLERRRSDQAWCRVLLDRGIDAFVAAWEALPMWSSQRAATDRSPAEAHELETRIRRQRAIRRGHDPRALAHCLRVAGLGSMPNLWPRLSSVRAPVQLVCGALDTKFRAVAERAAGEFPDASIALVDRAGHNPVLEAPRSIAAIIENGENDGTSQVDPGRGIRGHSLRQVR